MCELRGFFLSMYQPALFLLKNLRLCAATGINPQNLCAQGIETLCAFIITHK
jgi:hypothetical protein